MADTTHSCQHRFLAVNGIRMHIAEQGAGPLVVLLHGFPESWYAWRHQLGPIAAAGYRVVAPDMRGYGQTDCPEALDAHDIFQLTGDIVGLVNALGETSAVIVGHDWGALIAAYLSLFRPDLFRATVLLSVPYGPRRPMNQTDWEKQTYPGKLFYQAFLRSPMSEPMLQLDVRASLLRSLYSLSAQAKGDERFQVVREPGLPSAAPAHRPPWISEEDVQFLASQFQRTGFSGALNYYRNMDRNWALTPFLAGVKLVPPTLYLAGEADPVLDFLYEEFESLAVNAPNLVQKRLLPGVGHWIQQEAPDELNRALIEFLNAEIGVHERANPPV